MIEEPAKVLVVDDEPRIRSGLKILLRGAGYAVREAESGVEASAEIRSWSPDLVLLDLVLGEDDGLDVCREVRGFSQLPIVVLSAVGDEREKVRALDAGADDYVTKPFGADELLARLRAALRRAPGGAEGPVVEAGELRIDLVARTIARAGAPVHLTPIEFDLVAALARRRGRVVTHRELLRSVWGPAYTQETHYLRVHVAHIRAKLEDDPSRPIHVLTEPGVGYRFVTPDT